VQYVFKLEDGRVEPIHDLMKSEKEFALRRILVDGQTGARHLTFGYTRLDPITSYQKKHAHPHAEEVFYVLAGKGIGGVGENTNERMLVKGDAVWVPQGAVHWVYNPFDEACEILFLYTAPSLEAAGYEIIE
jgi:quercetin dioxygenase-like cupin family protein